MVMQFVNLCSEYPSCKTSVSIASLPLVLLICHQTKYFSFLGADSVKHADFVWHRLNSECQLT